MLLKISDFFVRQAKGWIILILLGIILLVNLFLIPPTMAHLNSPSGSSGALDLLFFYTPQQAYQKIASYGETGRAAYRTFALTTDVLYPLFYTLFFCLFISFLLRRSKTKQSRFQRLKLIPLGAGVFDLLENFSIVAMLSFYPRQLTWLAWLATTFTLLKWVFVLSSMLLCLAGIGLLIRNKWIHF